MIEETAHPARAWITFKGTVNVTEAHAHLKKKKKKKKKQMDLNSKAN